MVDGLFNGHRFRAFTIDDNFCRECLAIEAGQSLSGAEVAAVVERWVNERGAPDSHLPILFLLGWDGQS